MDELIIEPRYSRRVRVFLFIVTGTTNIKLT